MLQGNSLSLRTSLIVIMIVGLLLRLKSIADLSFWDDEIVYLQLSKQIIPLLTGQSAYVAPPLFPLLLSPLLYWTEEQFILLLLPVFFGMVSLYSFYYLASKVFNIDTAMYGIFLLSLAPIHIYYSRQLKQYSLFILTVIVSYIIFIAFAGDETNKKWSLKLGIANVAILYTHYFGVLHIFSQILAGIIVRKQYPHLLRYLFLSLMVTIGLFLPFCICTLPDQLYKFFRFNPTWIRSFDLSFLFHTIERFSAGYHSPKTISIILGMLMGSLLLKSIFTLLRSGKMFQDLGVIAVASGLLVPLATISVVSIFINVYLDRYLVFLIVPFLLLVAHEMTLISRLFLRLLLPCLIALLLFMPHAFIHKNRIPREDAGIFMKKDVRGCALVVDELHDKGYSFINSSQAILNGLNYYCDRKISQPFVTLKQEEFLRFQNFYEESSRYNPDFPPHFLPFAVLNKSMICLIHTSWPTLTDENQDVKQWMISHYELKKTYSFQGIELMLFSNSWEK